MTINDALRANLKLDYVPRPGGIFPLANIDHERLAEMWMRGDKLVEMAAVFGVSISLVSKRARKIGLPRRGMSSGELPQARIEAMYRDGESVAEIARLVRCSGSQVCRILRVRGVAIRPAGPRRMSPESIQACVRLYRRGLRQSEIAARLGMSRGQVSMRLAAAMEMPTVGGPVPRVSSERLLELRRRGLGYRRIGACVGMPPQQVRARLLNYARMMQRAKPAQAGLAFPCGPAGLDCGSDAGVVDAEGGGERQDGSPSRRRQSVDQAADGMRPEPSPVAPFGEPSFPDDVGKEVAEGLGALAAHEQVSSRTDEKKLDVVVDKSGESDDNEHIETTPPAADFDRLTASEVHPTSETRDQTMTTLPALLTYCQPSAADVALAEYAAVETAWRADRSAEGLIERSVAIRKTLLDLDLLPLSAEQRQATLRAVIGNGDCLATVQADGIVCHFRPRWSSRGPGLPGGELQECIVDTAGVEDVDQFVARYGAPVTHARALEIAEAHDIDWEACMAAADAYYADCAGDY